MPTAGMFRVGGEGTAERVLARGPRRPRFAVNAGGEAQKLVRKPTRPVLHPTLGHVGQNAPRSVLDRLSAPEDPEGTVARFARATRRQAVEFHGTVHPLSGRLMSLARGNEVSTAGGLNQMTRPTTRRLIGLMQRTDNPEHEQRAREALTHTGRLAGPRPIAVHNHPTFPGGGTRHLPSALDTQGATQPLPLQNRVVSLVPHARRGAPKTHETKFGYLPGTRDGKTALRQQEQLIDADKLTTPPGVLQQLRRGGYQPLPIQRAQHQMTRAEHTAGSREGSRQSANSIVLNRSDPGRLRQQTGVPVGASYDAVARGLTRPRRTIGRDGGFYTSERVRKARPRLIRLERLPRGAGEHRDALTWPLSLLDEDPKRGAAAARRLVAVRRLRYKGDTANVRVHKSLSRTATKTLRTAVAGAHPRQLAQHPAGLAFAGTGAAATAAPAHSSRGRKAKDTALGAVAGQVAYQGAGYAAEHQARHQVRWNARMSELPPGEGKHRVKLEQRARGRWRRAHEEAGSWHGGMPYRDFPLEHRRARTFRALGYTHAGHTGDLLGATVTAAGAIAGYRHAARVHQSGPPTAVGKSASYGFQEKRIRPVRAVEFTAGAGLVAYGGPRLQMAGPLIRTGATLVERYGGAAAAAKAIAAAEKARGALLAGTAPLEGLRRIDRVNHAVEVVPRHLRPAVATTVGALLMARSHPVRQPVFVPLGGS